MLEHARAYLEGDPVQHNLVLTLLEARVAIPEPGRYAWVEDGGEVRGVFFQSPLTFFGQLTPMARPAVDAIVAAVAEVAPDLRGIAGEASTAAAFAGGWTEFRRVPAEPMEGQRLYRLASLVMPPPVAGRARLASLDDLAVVTRFLDEFHAETEVDAPGDDLATLAERFVRLRPPWIWEDAGPVSMVGVNVSVAGVSRIGPVYTPPACRGRGYAAACTAHASAVVVDGGATAILYTQLHNPTSNAIYRRLGYEPVSELVRYEFGTSRSR